jgi:tetrahydromethanopterin S-methyltransferase subunit D
MLEGVIYATFSGICFGGGLVLFELFKYMLTRIIFLASLFGVGFKFLSVTRTQKEEMIEAVIEFLELERFIAESLLAMALASVVIIAIVLTSTYILEPKGRDK